MKKFILITTLVCIAGSIQAGICANSYHALAGKDSIIRKKLLLASFPARQVSSADVREISFKPLQKTGRHLHPIPVIGYIVNGTVLFQIEGQPSKILHAGDAFYEPANTIMAHFDNLSAKAPLKFICTYLLNGGTDLIKMLPEVNEAKK